MLGFAHVRDLRDPLGPLLLTSAPPPVDQPHTRIEVENRKLARNPWTSRLPEVIPEHWHSQEPCPGGVGSALEGCSAIVATVYFVVIGLLLVWGGWLLVTDDPDGGRHPVGGVMLAVAALCGILGLVSFRRSRRP